jgi:hypothetical protein
MRHSRPSPAPTSGQRIFSRWVDFQVVDSLVRRNGVPQEPIVITRTKPDLGPEATESTFVYVDTGAGDPSMPQTSSAESTEARVGACTLSITSVFKIGPGLIHADWAFTCSHDTTFGLDSCIYRGDGKEMGCNHPRHEPVYGGFWTGGGRPRSALRRHGGTCIGHMSSRRSAPRVQPRRTGGFPARPVMVLFRLIVLASTALVAIAPGQGAVSNRTVGPDAIGAYGVHEPYRAAARAFGLPTSRVSRAIKGCYVTWGRVGIRARYAGTCRSPLHLITASVTARGWETRRGLRIGDRVARVRALYPDSRGRHLAAGGLRFNISGPVLSVIVKRGRIARLDLAVGRTASVP